MRTIKQPLFLIYFLLWLSFCIACTSKKHIVNRPQFEMPKLLDFEKFKSQIPINELKSFRSYAKVEQRMTPLLNYYFNIDTSGNIVEGKIDESYEKDLSFFKAYIRDVFNTYRWRPAFYTNSEKEKIKASLKMSIYDNPNSHMFEVTVRLVYLPEKEKIGDTYFLANLIYKFKIR